jgi:hypothetical protein
MEGQTSEVEATPGGGETKEAPQPDENEPASFPSTDEIPTSTDGGTTGTLLNILSRHPFLGIYEKTADRGDLGTRGRVCFALEVILTIVVLALVLAIIAAVAWKTLAPLPHV